MKYTDIKVSNQCNVSSSHDYWATVFYHEHGYGPFKIQFCFSGEFAFGVRGGYARLPKYFVREAVRQFREAVYRNRMTFFEYNRDGEKRFTELRYHDKELLNSIMQSWQKRYNLTLED